MYEEEIPIHRKNQAHEALGHLLKVLPQFSWVIVLSGQLDYNIVVSLSQVIFAKGGSPYVYF